MYHSFLDLLRYKIKYCNTYKNIYIMKSMLIKFVVNKIQHECYYSFILKLITFNIFQYVFFCNIMKNGLLYINWRLKMQV